MKSQGDGVSKLTDLKESPVIMITTFGIDLAKAVFQVYGVNGFSKSAVNRRHKRKDVTADRQFVIGHN